MLHDAFPPLRLVTLFRALSIAMTLTVDACRQIISPGLITPAERSSLAYAYTAAAMFLPSAAGPAHGIALAVRRRALFRYFRQTALYDAT